MEYFELFILHAKSDSEREREMHESYMASYILGAKSC